MKLFIILAVAFCANADKLNRNYLPPSFAQSSGGSGSFLDTPKSGPQGGQFHTGAYQQSNDYANQNGYSGQVNNGFVRSERPQSSFERNAGILRLDNENDGEKYAYAYETENGIYAEEQGVATHGVNAQGGFSYTGDDGKQYSISYTADENGFQPRGDHLPTPPPIPEEILKALEQNARDEAAGIYDDGSYKQNKYDGGNDNGYPSNNYNNYYNNNYNNKYNNYNNDQNDAVVTNAANARRYNSFNSRPTNFRNNNGNLRSYLPPTY